MKRGAEAEDRAAQHLAQQGLTLLQRNYRSRHGEIDLIMQDHGTLVFIEVRQRSRTDFGGAAASIVAAKQARIIATAQHYLTTLKRVPPCRFDAVLLHGAEDARIEWIKGAFEA